LQKSNISPETPGLQQRTSWGMLKRKTMAHVKKIPYDLGKIWRCASNLSSVTSRHVTLGAH
jgi:hypothetical protein